MQEQAIAYAVGGMLECALWSSVDDNGEPLDSGRGIEAFHPDTTASLIGELRDFIAANAADIAASGMDGGQTGHDFWLSRNRHGAGFWDRGLGEVGERLTAAAHTYGEVDLFVDTDGTVYRG